MSYECCALFISVSLSVCLSGLKSTPRDWPCYCFLLLLLLLSLLSTVAKDCTQPPFMFHRVSFTHSLTHSHTHTNRSFFLIHFSAFKACILTSYFDFRQNRLAESEPTQGLADILNLDWIPDSQMMMVYQWIF